MITVASETVWEAPPAVERPNSGAAPSPELMAKAALLRENEGKWAIIGYAEKLPQSSALAHRINKGISRAFAPAGTFEAVSRPVSGVKDEEGNEYGGAVYARYVGEDVDPVKVLVSDHKLGELKAMAKAADLSVSGTKEEVAQRLVDHEAAVNAAE
jgi:hypothetical protein